MARNLLHKTKLEDFKAWLDAQAIAHRPGRGDWQVLQVLIGTQWHVVYERNHMPEHFTTVRHLDKLVASFCRERKE